MTGPNKRIERRDTDERNRWDGGLVRHLRVDPEHPLDSVTAARVGDINAEDGVDVLYTLIVHPKHLDRVEELRRQAELNPGLGGAFSPEPAP